MTTFEEDFWAPTTGVDSNQGVQLGGPMRVTATSGYSSKTVIGERDSFFDGNILVAVAHLISTYVLSLATLGIMMPFMINMTCRYFVTRTVLDGERLKWEGTLFGWVIFTVMHIFLLIVTLGFWMILFPFFFVRTFVKKLTFGGDEEVSYFEGSIFTYLLYIVIYSPVTVFSFGLAFPWVLTSFIKYFCINSYIDGRRMMFNATGLDTAITMLRIGFLMIITLGIYSFWGIVDMYVFITVNTTFAYEQE